MAEQEELVRKAVMVPPALWHRIKVDAVIQEIDVSDIVVDALKQYYAAKDKKADGKAQRELAGVDGH